MSLTARVVLAIALGTLAATAAIVVFADQAQREAAEARVADTVISAMSAGARERCELDPSAFVAFAGGPVRGPGPHAPMRRFPTVVGPRFAVYSRDGTSMSGAPRLAADVVAELEGEVVVTLPEHAGHARFLVRMPWDAGPCAIVGVERPPIPQPAVVRRRGFFFALVVLAVTSLAAVLALRSPLSRLRALTAAASTLGRSGFRDRTAIDDATKSPSAKDEVGALGASLREAVDRIAADAARLSARDAALTEYVAHTTHDLMTPITVLTGHLSELEQELTSGRPADLRTVERAIVEAHYLATLIANLGVVARLDRPDPIVQKRSIDLRDVVTRVAARHEPLARARGLSLEHAVPDAPVLFDGDDLLLERALGNLVHNAIRHHRAREGTEGHVAVTLTSPDATGAGPAVRVLDDGAGPDDATLRAMQSPTAETDDVRTRTHGFGMDVVRRVASLHGLELTIERASEGGLEVTLVRRDATPRGGA